MHGHLNVRFVYYFFCVNKLPLGFCDRASWANCEVREKTNKTQQLDVYYQYFLNMFRTSRAESNLHSARTLQDSAPQPLPTTSSRTRYVADFTLNLHPLYQPAHHRHTPPSAPNNTYTTHPPIKQAQRMHQYTHPRYTRPEKRTIQIPVQRYDTPICTRHSHIRTRSHLGLLHTTPQKRHYS